jgi:hypothetical protein
MRQSVCERLACHGKMGEPIENCTPVSAAFQQTFADATVEDIAIGWHGAHARAAVKFSNGVVVCSTTERALDDHAAESPLRQAATG